MRKFIYLLIVCFVPIELAEVRAEGSAQTITLPPAKEWCLTELNFPLANLNDGQKQQDLLGSVAQKFGLNLARFKISEFGVPFVASSQPSVSDKANVDLTICAVVPDQAFSAKPEGIEPIKAPSRTVLAKLCSPDELDQCVDSVRMAIKGPPWNYSDDQVDQHELLVRSTQKRATDQETVITALSGPTGLLFSTDTGNVVSTDDPSQEINVVAISVE